MTAWRSLWIAAALLACCANGQENHRLALAIGNDAYPKSPLRNGAKDAHAVSVALRGLGIEVDEVTNVKLKALANAVDAFVAKLHPGDVAIVYYSGLGIQINGENYLVPVDFQLREEADVKFSAYETRRLLERLESAGTRLRIIILDSGSDNPWKPDRPVAGGLPTMDSGRGTFLATATAPGKTASDNSSGTNGLFTHFLLNALQRPGLSLESLFQQVREDVYKASNGRQLPWTASSVIEDFYFHPGKKDAADSKDADALWNSGTKETTPEFLREYLRKYPHGMFAELARRRLKQLESEPKPVSQ